MTRTLAASAALMLLGTGAFAQDVNYDYDSSADFTRFKTYSWVRGHPVEDELNHRRVVAAIDSQLGLKGLRKVERDSHPDLLVAYHASFNRTIEVNGLSSGFGGFRFGGSRSGTARVDELVIGTLIVDMVNAGSRTIVWRGVARKEIDPNADPERRERNINKAAEKLFRNYPPKK
jgi:hypothetical protein